MIISAVVTDLFDILYEDDELLAINKPAGLVCHPTKTDEYSSLISRIRLHLKNRGHPQLVNRLDRETSGVTLVAKESTGARELRRIWEQRRVEKEYLALVHGRVSHAQGVIEAPLGRDELSQVAVKDCVRPDGLPSRTQWEVIDTTNSSNFSLLRVFPCTGRKHQIRIHLAHIGHPIVGDKLYGGDEDLYLALVQERLTKEQQRRLLLPNHALHAAALRFLWRGEQKEFRAPDPSQAWWAATINSQATA